MIQLTWNKNFEKALKKYIKKHPELESRIQEKLRLFVEEPYSAELRNHGLSGKLNDLRAIVIDYDCRLVFKFIDEETALLVNIGSHDEVY